MTESQIKELRRLLAEATPGPWVKDYGFTFGHIKSVAKERKPGTPTVCRYDGPNHAPTISEDEAGVNAALIVAAKNALQDLLDERDRLRATVKELLMELRVMRIADHCDPVDTYGMDHARAALNETATKEG
jgi:hypothetical protein